MSVASQFPPDSGYRYCVLALAETFVFDCGRVVLRKTGNSAPLDVRLAGEVASWLLFQNVIQVRAAPRRATRPAGPAIGFSPDRPGP